MEEQTTPIQQKTNTKPRQSNFDLLKIFAFVFVVVLHYMNEGIGGGLLYSTGATNVVFRSIESIAIVAVPIFVLITGYFSKNSKTFNFKKIFGIYIMQFSYVAICYVGDVLIFKKPFDVGLFFSSFAPVNYYINFYAVLMIIAPFLNCIFKLSRKNVNAIMIASIILFVIFPSIIDIGTQLVHAEIPAGLSFITRSGSFGGYTIVVFVLIYLIGAYIREYNITIRKLITMPIFIVITAIITVLSIYVGGCIWDYDNIFVLASAITLFLFFKEINLKEIKIISVISKCSLGVYLLHATVLFEFSYFGLFNIQANIEAGFGYAILNMLAVVFSTVGICVVLDILLRLVVSPLRNWLYKQKFLNYNIIDLKEQDKQKED